MSTSASLPGRMNRVLATSGYESPGLRDGELFGKGKLEDEGERRRGVVHESSDDTCIGDTRDSPVYLNGAAPMELSRIEEKRGPEKVGFRGRVGCYTWTWFAMTMATGGIANVLHSIPYRSESLRIFGVIFALFNIVLFIFNCVLITLRFRWNPGSFRASFKCQTESLFIPASVVSVGTILTNICQYGIPETGEWLQTTMKICFWAYASLSVMASSLIYLILWSTQAFPIHTMTPIWIFPAYPLLLVAPFAANLIDSLPDAGAASRINSIAISAGAICLQGTGFLLSLMIYSAFIYRLMTQKLPRETTRPGMFVSVGPSGFTVAGIVQLGNLMSKILPHGLEGHSDAGFTLKLLSDLLGLWLWGLCLWFFIVSVGAHSNLMRPNDPDHHIHFDITWYSFVFPNTAMTTATQALARSLRVDAIHIVGTVMAGLVILMWIFVFYMMIRAIILKRILWPVREIHCVDADASSGQERAGTDGAIKVPTN